MIARGWNLFMSSFRIKKFGVETLLRATGREGCCFTILGNLYERTYHSGTYVE